MIQPEKKITAKNIPDFEPLSSGHRACQGCAEILAQRLVLKAIGKDAIVVSATGCMEVVTTPYPQTAWNMPWLHVAFENASAVASGVIGARSAMVKKQRIKKNSTKVIVMGGDGATADIGFQSLSGALERGHDFVYVCFDNEAYMNTGVQRSSSTPPGAWTTTSPLGEYSDGKQGGKKDMAAIAAAHNIPYVATACPGYPFDLMNKARKAALTPGPAYLHVLAPCPTGWRMDTRFGVRISKLAVDTRVFPLYEIIDGQYVLSKKGKKNKPVEDYLKIQGRFKHLRKESVKTIQENADKRFAELEWLAGSIKN
ncbi:MAG: pyruvate synthase subunit beta [Deltaproteobacteria bacterium]|nr:MAG: pyruvate synthase subunit beta [Deltaproteobacteria bacterium]